jgi:anti-anti-sigma factor
MPDMLYREYHERFIMHKKPHLHIEERAGCLWIILPSSIDMSNRSDIEDEIHMHLTSAIPCVVLDMRKTKYIYSSGLNLIVKLKNAIEQWNGKIVIVNVGPKAREILEKLNLHKIVDCYTTESEFMATIGMQ